MSKHRSIQFTADERTHLEQSIRGGDAPARTDPDDPFIQMVAETASEVFGVPMTLVPLTGGSGP